MAKIVLDNVGHRYDTAIGSEGAYALQPMQLEWEDGGAYALLGPSGCGKTTLLNIISGLLEPSEGRVWFDDKDVTALPTEQRNIAQVFQFPVVYDTMTVAENLAFPLKNRKLPVAQRDERVAHVLELLGLTEQADKKARNLNADNKQKISLGRGLVRTDANAVLFDEPLTVIDPALKWQLRAQLKKVHQQIGHTMIYVTHDQTEALTFADKVVVMLAGAVLQVGTPQELFDRPQHTFVGQFIGSPGMNILPCRLERNVALMADIRIALGDEYPAVDGQLELGIRPENIDLVEMQTYPQASPKDSPKASPKASPRPHPVKITAVDDIGRFKIVQMLLGQQPIKVLFPEGWPLPQSPGVVFPPQHINIYRNSVLLPPIVGGVTL